MKKTDHLNIAEESLKDVPGITIVKSFEWFGNVQKWAISVAIELGDHSCKYLPRIVNCYILLDPNYPMGTVIVFPEKNSFTATFPHQLFNDEYLPEIPWRRGEICMASNLRALKRRGFDDEPFVSQERLRWVVLRLKLWFSSAINDTLTQDGDPFELPEFHALTINGHQRIIANKENHSFLERWNTLSEYKGYVNVLFGSEIRGTAFIHTFESDKQIELVRYEWGDYIQGIAKEPLKGIWIRLPSPPIIPPYQAPSTWGELRHIFNEQEVNFDEQIKTLLAGIRDGDEHLFLLGFPIPNVYGGKHYEMTWKTAVIPALSHGKVEVDGFKSNSEDAHCAKDMRDIFSNNERIIWLDTQNWSADTVSIRGKVKMNLRNKHILIIGAGALGSVMSELLVRNGVERLTIIDNALLEVGNLVRHTLTLADVSRQKGEMLAERLRIINPNSSIAFIPKLFAPSGLTESDIANISKCDLVIDCTASDDVIEHLKIFEWNDSKHICSMSLGYGAKRLFFFSSMNDVFPAQEFWNRIEPWIKQDKETYNEDDFPLDGVGCWHPVFPARVDDIWMMASAGIKCIEESLNISDTNLRFAVIEQYYDEDKFIGIRRVESTW